MHNLILLAEKHNISIDAAIACYRFGWLRGRKVTTPPWQDENKPEDRFWPLSLAEYSVVSADGI